MNIFALKNYFVGIIGSYVRAFTANYYVTNLNAESMIKNVIKKTLNVKQITISILLSDDASALILGGGVTYGLYT